ncbi:MAG: hypothetical protein LBS01_08295 [Prevotellaceae bacterium]|jgi:hypothetical protein|nr:hypothetical protein [Prevotellaceae bacterium]
MNSLLPATSPRSAAPAPATAGSAARYTTQVFELRRTKRLSVEFSIISGREMFIIF